MQITVKSHTNPATSYQVTLPDNPAAEPFCTCKGYGYRRACSHVKEAIQQLNETIKQETKRLTGLQLDMASLVRQCACGVPLRGTHTLLDKCPACYRKETFHAV